MSARHEKAELALLTYLLLRDPQGDGRFYGRAIWRTLGMRARLLRRLLDEKIAEGVVVERRGLDSRDGSFSRVYGLTTRGVPLAQARVEYLRSKYRVEPEVLWP